MPCPYPNLGTRLNYMAALDDKTTTWVRRATRAYNSGQYGECEKCLQEALSHIGAFSRLRWSVESNLLACRIQGAVTTGRPEQLEGICSSYESLWEKVSGLPPNVDSIQTEVATVCAMCQLVVLLQAHFSIATKFTSEWSIQHCNTLIGRICSYFGVEESPITQALPAVVESFSVNGDAFAVKGILKLMFSRAVMHLLHDEQEDAVKLFSSIWAALNRQTEHGCGQELFNTAIKTKRLVEESLSGRDEVFSSEHEHKYSEAWQLFSREDYHPALDILHSLLQTSSLPDVTTSVARLLAGGCCASMHKPNLALCSYQQCLKSRSNVAVLPALHSCATVYKTMGNAEAEMGMRKILLEALKLQEEQKETTIEQEKILSGVMLWAGGLRGEKVSLHPGCPSRLELLEATYTAAYRAMQLCRYKESAVMFMEIIRVLESGSKALHPSHPPPSTLYLLSIKTLLCNAEYEQAQLLCSKLVDTLLPGVESYLSLSPSSAQTNMMAALSHTLVLAQAFYFRAIATVQVNKFQESRAYCERCLKLVTFMLPRLTGGDQLKMLNCAKTVQAHALNHLAVLSIGQRNNTQALRLLAEALASSTPTLEPANSDVSLEMESDCDAVTSSKKINPLPSSEVSSTSGQCLAMVFNHYLLQCKLGRVADAARGWLEERGKLPDTVHKGRQGLAEAKKTLAKLKREGKDHYSSVMDAAMLGEWLRHASK